MTLVVEVLRDDIQAARIANDAAEPLTDGQTLFRVERFGLTTNNVTYGLYGDDLRYWAFFPTRDDDWGRVPAWGFATAVKSRCADVPVGTRVFGYVPMGGDVVMTPGGVTESGFHDEVSHRSLLPRVYNTYRRAEPSAHDDATMILTPLFATSVLLARSLEGQGRVIFSSASSKTALGTARLLRRRGVATAGITASRTFVEDIDVYDEVVGYDAVGSLRKDPATFVDVAGRRSTRAAVHGHLGDALAASIVVGATHADASDTAVEPLPGPSPTFFFAPDHVGGGIDGDSLTELIRWGAGWLEIERRDGADAVLAAWADAAAGSVAPTVAFSLALG